MSKSIKELTTIDEVVAKLAVDPRVDQIINRFNQSNRKVHLIPEICIEMLKDFKQDLLIMLFEYKDKQKIINLFNSGEIYYFITRIVFCELTSTDRYFWRRYQKYYNKKVGLEVLNENGELDILNITGYETED